MPDFNDVIVTLRYGGREIAITFPMVDEWMLRSIVNSLRTAGFLVEVRQRQTMSIEI